MRFPRTCGVLTVVCFAFVVACSSKPDAGLAILDVRAHPPLTRNGAGVAYFRIRNDGDSEASVTDITSPQFETVSLHETILKNGMSSMRMVAGLSVPAHSEIELQPGGLHVMLMDAQRELAANDPLTLVIETSVGTLVIDTAFRSRDGEGSNE